MMKNMKWWRVEKQKKAEANDDVGGQGQEKWKYSGQIIKDCQKKRESSEQNIKDWQKKRES